MMKADRKWNDQVDLFVWGRGQPRRCTSVMFPRLDCLARLSLSSASPPSQACSWPSLMSRSALFLKHSSRAAQLTHSDRYSVIRTFFTRPVPPSPSPPFSLTRRPAPVLPPTFPLHPHRNFHSARSTRDNRPSKNTAPKRPRPLEKPQKAAPNSPPTHDGLRPDNSHTHLYDNNYPRFFRRLAQSLPHTHVARLSRDDFLNAANGIVQRMRVRVRWFFIRNFRKFNADDISAFVTWFLVGQGLWILIGTSVGIAMCCPPKCLLFPPQNNVLFCCICGGE